MYANEREGMYEQLRLANGTTRAMWKFFQDDSMTASQPHVQHLYNDAGQDLVAN